MKNNGLFCALSVLLSQVVVYFGFTRLSPELSTVLLSKEITYCAIVLLLGTVILYWKHKKEQFVARFLLLTVFQMFAILSFLLALVYLKVDSVKTYAVLLVVSYLIGMFIQSIFFLSLSKKED